MASRPTPHIAVRTLQRFGVLIPLCLALGCGGAPGAGTTSIEGDITVKGKPLEQGDIVFENVDANAKPKLAVGNIASGHFTVERVPPGNFKVMVKPKPTEAKPADLPEKYLASETSGLTAEVKSGSNPRLKFDLIP